MRLSLSTNSFTTSTCPAAPSLLVCEERLPAASPVWRIRKGKPALPGDIELCHDHEPFRLVDHAVDSSDWARRSSLERFLLGADVKHSSRHIKKLQIRLKVRRKSMNIEEKRFGRGIKPQIATRLTFSYVRQNWSAQSDHGQWGPICMEFS